MNKQSEKFTVQINYDGGIYALYPQQLAPGASAVFDIRKIRDNQTPDSSGRLMPRNLTVGQIRWSMVGSSATRMIGRSEIISKSGKVSSSYSCGVCCRNSYASSYLTPNQVFAYVDDITSLTAEETDHDCYGNYYAPYGVSATWSSSDETIAYFNNYTIGQATAMDVGDVQITATWDAEYSVDDGSDGCLSFPMTPAPTGEMTVRPRCAVPTHFRRTSGGADEGEGVLYFKYEFDSSTGNLADLSACTVGEIVSYPGSGPYYFPPSPPFWNVGYINPTIFSDLPATTGAIEDHHRLNGDFVKPYSSASFTATQYYRYKCPCKNNGDFVNLLGPLDLVRSITPVAGTSNWKYTVTKSGFSATINPLP